MFTKCIKKLYINFPFLIKYKSKPLYTTLIGLNEEDFNKYIKIKIYYII